MGANVGRLVLAATVTVALAAWGQTSTSPTTVASASDSASASVSASVRGPDQGHEYPGTICRGVNFDRSDPIPAGARRRLDPSFAPVTVVKCSFDFERIPGRGEWAVLIEQRASSELTALVRAMRQPDTTAAAGVLCTMNLQLDPEVWLLDAAGQAVLPGWPRDGCDHIPAPATNALDALHWTTVARVQIAQMIPQAALDAGCEPSWKYLFDLSAGNESSPKPGGFADLAHSTDPHLCVYRRATDAPLAHGGTFASGRAISPTAWTAIRAALDATPPAAACDRSATRFAVLLAGPYVEIELDGCRRVLTPDNGLRQATPGLASLLT